MEGTIEPVALGLKVDPPTLVLSYDLYLTEIRKRRRKRSMPLRNFSDRCNVSKTEFSLRQRHEKYLANVLPITIIKMLKIIQEVLKGCHIDEAVRKVELENSIDPNENLNKLSTAELDLKKQVMEEGFQKNLIAPGHPDYIYDKVEIFDFEDKKPSEWDEFEDEINHLESNTTVGSGTCDGGRARNSPLCEPENAEDLENPVVRSLDEKNILNIFVQESKDEKTIKTEKDSSVKVKSGQDDDTGEEQFKNLHNPLVQKDSTPETNQSSGEGRNDEDSVLSLEVDAKDNHPGPFNSIWRFTTNQSNKNPSNDNSLLKTSGLNDEKSESEDIKYDFEDFDDDIEFSSEILEAIQSYNSSKITHIKEEEHEVPENKASISIPKEQEVESLSSIQYPKDIFDDLYLDDVNMPDDSDGFIKESTSQEIRADPYEVAAEAQVAMPECKLSENKPAQKDAREELTTPTPEVFDEISDVHDAGEEWSSNSSQAEELDLSKLLSLCDTGNLFLNDNCKETLPYCGSPVTSNKKLDKNDAYNNAGSSLKYFESTVPIEDEFNGCLQLGSLNDSVDNISSLQRSVILELEDNAMQTKEKIQDVILSSESGMLEKEFSAENKAELQLSDSPLNLASKPAAVDQLIVGPSNIKSDRQSVPLTIGDLKHDSQIISKSEKLAKHETPTHDSMDDEKSGSDLEKEEKSKTEHVKSFEKASSEQYCNSTTQPLVKLPNVPSETRVEVETNGNLVEDPSSAKLEAAENSLKSDFIEIETADVIDDDDFWA